MPPARPMLPRDALRSAGLVSASVACFVGFACLALAQTGCYFSDTGLTPPGESFYFPTGLAVSPGRTALYVANSDFDLQFNGGTVQVVDLASIRARLAPILDGVRHSQPSVDACVALEPICNGVPVSDPGAGGQGTRCTTLSDCASAVCVLGSDGLNGVCQPCAKDTDCATGKCGADALKGRCVLTCNGNQILSPSACSSLAPPFQAFGAVGAFASGAVLTLDPDKSVGGARLFVPVRGDPSITWFDVADDRTGTPGVQLDCGAPASGDRRCADEHRMGVDPYDNFRDLTIPVEPVGLDASIDGRWIVSAHQIATGPAIGLSSNDWASHLRPSFDFSLTGNVAAGPTEVAHVPPPAIIAASQATPAPVAYQPGFLVTYNAAPEVDLFRVNDDHESSPPRPFLTRAGQTSITVNADGKDSRGIAVDPSERQACERACDAKGTGTTAFFGCLRACVDIPLRLYIANRAPPSLLLGRVRTVVVDSDKGAFTGSAAFDVAEIYSQTSLSVGPSKVALGGVIAPDGTRRSLVFAVTFDSRFIFAYDPVAARVIGPFWTGRGPHAIGFDACLADCGPGEQPHAYLYVGHFTDSYLGVIDLDMRHPETFGTMFASIGTPLAPQESK